MIGHREPTKEQLQRMQFVNTMGQAMLTMIEERCPPGRERSLAVTKLEECTMWAVKAIAMEEKE